MILQDLAGNVIAHDVMVADVNKPGTVCYSKTLQSQYTFGVSFGTLLPVKPHKEISDCFWQL